MYKGVIIDFNGTLYLDHDLNHKGWEIAFNSVKPSNFNKTYEEVEQNINILPKDYDYSKELLKTLNLDTSSENIIKLYEYKEEIYRNLITIFNRNELMNGATTFLDYLKDNNIPYCIASMALLSNFKFYLEYLNLKKWFTLDNIVCDSDLYKNKNEQYIEAAKKMGLDIKDCLIIEDSPRVIENSLLLGDVNIIYLNSKHINYQIPNIKQEINDFTEFDYNLLKNSL